MKLTIFTPTYNRGYIIENLYKSLQKQTCADFEWMVIDDGSDDHTSELFEIWINENNTFPIRYYKVANGGKHRAINMAMDLAKGELFFIVDSDDYLTENALEKIINWEKSIQFKESFCGVAGVKGKSVNEPWGTTFVGEFIDSTNLDRDKNNITGDKAEIFYTHILKRYRFQEFENETFITERTVWDEMAYDGYKIRWFNEVIYICDYLKDGLTQSGDAIFSNNPQGTAYLLKQQIQFKEFNLKDKLSNYGAYYKLVKSKAGLKQSARYLGINPVTLVVSIVLVKCKELLVLRQRT